MTYQLSITQQSCYLHFIVSGENSENNVIHYLEDVLQECINRGCRKVLIEERLAGPRLKTFPVYEIARDGSDNARGHFDAIAYVDVNASGDLMEFAETVAMNRGLPVHIFATVAEAEKWLHDIVIKNKSENNTQDSSETTN